MAATLTAPPGLHRCTKRETCQKLRIYQMGTFHTMVTILLTTSTYACMLCRLRTLLSISWTGGSEHAHVAVALMAMEGAAGPTHTVPFVLW